MSRPQAGAGRGSLGAALTAVPVSPAVQRQRALQVRVDKEIDSLAQNFTKMLAASKIHDPTKNAQEGFQAQMHAARMVQAAEGLLKLVSELKQHSLFTNFAALNQAVEADQERMREATADAIESINGVAEGAAALLQKVQDLRYKSLVVGDVTVEFIPDASQ